MRLLRSRGLFYDWYSFLMSVVLFKDKDKDFYFRGLTFYQDRVLFNIWVVLFLFFDHDFEDKARDHFCIFKSSSPRYFSSITIFCRSPLSKIKDFLGSHLFFAKDQEPLFYQSSRPISGTSKSSSSTPSKTLTHPLTPTHTPFTL